MAKKADSLVKVGSEGFNLLEYYLKQQADMLKVIRMTSNPVPILITQNQPEYMISSEEAARRYNGILIMPKVPIIMQDQPEYLISSEEAARRYNGILIKDIGNWQGKPRLPRA
ncbi:hypothetical protein I3843_02G066400 [Carya illinoinensis]|uniref:Uncharacterized protein n=1 Tax=Carya illinoinensis TaxID=32201 RepID=A0A8T1RB37_CARIL|nr:hypothetical protein I3760_02G080200 [Carya illinoinensis]KAG6664248.1 hypothetical protein CIPAW_02G079600 [Carya illinoinensis]KAG6726392.1 hypothetical protein I3842_02G078800 [Carya illinoinensis]KAG7991269.1 hypothetical protein I3843_02G066400 [Carya illinoinensis]